MTQMFVQEEELASILILADASLDITTQIVHFMTVIVSFSMLLGQFVLETEFAALLILAHAKMVSQDLNVKVEQFFQSLRKFLEGQQL